MHSRSSEKKFEDQAAKTK